MDRRQFIAAAAGTAAAVALHTRHGSAAGPTCRYVPVTPTRLLDTRNNDTSPPLGAGTYVDIQIGGRAVNGGVTIPTNARAVVLNVTCTQSQAPGYVSVFPWGANATGTSVLNLNGWGQTVAALVTVQVASNGLVQLYTLAGSHLIADVLGYYEEVGSSTEGRLIPRGPFRLHDTRDGAGAFGPGEARTYQVTGAPPDTKAVVLNVTIDNAWGPGFWTLWQGGGRPLASNVNTNFPGHVVANQAIVPLRDGAWFDVFSLAGGDLILDVAGWYTGRASANTTSGLFVPVSPQRLLDTREGGDLNPLTDQYQWRARKPHSGWTVEVPVIGRAGVPGNAAAVALSVTLTSSEAAGYVTAYPARTYLPLASNVNTSWAGNTVANHAITPITPYGFSLYTFGGAHLIADINGYFLGTPTQAYTAKVSNPRTPGMWFPNTLYVPRLTPNPMTCQPATEPESILYYGPGHLPNTSLPGGGGNCAVFGHRTSHTHPFLYIDQMQYGDGIQFSGPQGVATYMVYELDPIVDPTDPSMYYTGSDTPTCTLIACTPPHSTRYRIVARGILTDYVEY